MKRTTFTVVIVLLVISIIAVSYWGLVNNRSEDEEVVPSGDIARVVPVSSKEIHLIIGKLTERLPYEKCRFVIEAPGSIETVVFDLDAAALYYQAPVDSCSLSYVKLLDQDEDGMLEEGDVISLFNTQDLMKGQWTFILLYGSLRSLSLYELFVVPDMERTPYGSFHDVRVESGSKAVISFGLINTVVPFYYVKILISAPGSNETRIWNVEKGDSYVFSYNGTVWAYVSDADREDIIDYLDKIVIQATNGTLAKGVWRITAVYDFTNEMICHTSFEVGG